MTNTFPPNLEAWIAPEIDDSTPVHSIATAGSTPSASLMTLAANCSGVSENSTLSVRTLGQNLFYPPNVKGWPGGALWINSTTLLARKQFVEQLFRATETAGMHPPAHAMVPPPNAPNGRAHAMPVVDTASNAGMHGTPAKPARAGLRFDLERWLSQYRARPQAIAGLSTELQLQHAVLQMSPVAAIDTDSTGSAYLEALLMDPAYQLK